MNIKCLIVGELETNSYLVYDAKTREALIIDPGDSAQYIINVVRDLEIKPLSIIATHGHFDHILASFELQNAYEIPFLMNGKDKFMLKKMQQNAQFYLKRHIIELPPQLDQVISENETINVGGLKLTVIETPGHTPGSVCLYDSKQNILFNGDLLFTGGAVGRTDFNYSSNADLNNSLKKIFKLPGKTLIFPGHGGSSNIITEKKYYELAHYS
jgi:hydroxyacylglutathione hydrolase